MPDAPGTRAQAELVAEICARIASGESVRGVFEKPGPDYPDRATFWRWRCADDGYRKQYIEALRERSLLTVEEIDELAAEEPPDVRTQFGSHKDAAWVQWKKNQIDTRKWNAARMHPELFGDRTIVAGDADNPLHFVDDSAITSKLLPELAAGGTPEASGETDEGGS